MTEYESNATKKVIASINPDAKILTLTIKNADGNVISTGKYYAADDVNQSFVEGETSHKKNKMKLMADFGVGYEMRLKKFVIGAEASFCKKFGTVKNTFMLSPFQLIDNGNALADGFERSYSAANIVNATNGGVLAQSTLTNPNGGGDLTDNGLDNVQVIPVETAHLAHLLQFSIKYKSNWGMSFKPRIGYMVTPKLEVYATGGLKISESKISGGFDIDSTNNDAPGISTSIFRTEVSPIIGGGLIYSFNDNLFARLEYNFNAKSKSSLNVPPLSGASTTLYSALFGGGAGKTTGNVITHKFRNRSHDIKLGIGYRF